MKIPSYITNRTGQEPRVETSGTIIRYVWFTEATMLSLQYGVSGLAQHLRIQTPLGNVCVDLTHTCTRGIDAILPALMDYYMDGLL